MTHNPKSSDNKMHPMEKYKEEADNHIEQLIDIVALMTDEANKEEWSADVWYALKGALDKLYNVERKLYSVPDKPDVEINYVLSD